MTIFDIFKSFFNKNKFNDHTIEKYYDIYMINYLFSFHREYIDMSNMINKYHYKDKKKCYLFYYYVVDKKKCPFADIKRKKKNVIDEKQLKLAKQYLPEMSVNKIIENWDIIKQEL